MYNSLKYQWIVLQPLLNNRCITKNKNKFALDFYNISPITNFLIIFCTYRVTKLYTYMNANKWAKNIFKCSKLQILLIHKFNVTIMMKDMLLKDIGKRSGSG